MSTGVQENPDLTVTPMGKDNRAARNPARTKIAGLRDLRFMPRIDPATFKDPFVFESKDLRTAEGLTIDAKQPRFAVVDNEPFERDGIHVASFRSYTCYVLRVT
jgi:hypothetical protein